MLGRVLAQNEINFRVRIHRRVTPFTDRKHLDALRAAEFRQPFSEALRPDIHGPPRLAPLFEPDERVFGPRPLVDRGHQLDARHRVLDRALEEEFVASFSMNS